MTWPRQTDFLIIGGGIIGISIALELAYRYPDNKIVVLEKETGTGQHASGRNSGVLHAGFYYSADSHKARLTRAGNRELTEYCLERKLTINRCGKLVVTRNEAELDALNELFYRGKTNQVDVKLISATEAREIEPRARTIKQALYSPTTATVNPVEIMKSLTQDAEDLGVQFQTGCIFLNHDNSVVNTNKGKIEAGYVINTAGLYADRIAHRFGFANDFTILPFKGLYLQAEEDTQSLRCNIYPVPELGIPFLGVHLTVASDGRIKIGPTAIPALWRENYSGMQNFRPDEFREIIVTEIRLFFSNQFNFGKLAWEELGKINKTKLVKLALELIDDLEPRQFRKWGKPGIRAQLVNKKTRRLEMDFYFEGDDRSFHVLNAVSPAFTCALPFGRMVVDEIDNRVG